MYTKCQKYKRALLLTKERSKIKRLLLGEYGKDSGFCFRSNGKPLKRFKQRRHVVKFQLLKNTVITAI